MDARMILSLIYRVCTQHYILYTSPLIIPTAGIFCDRVRPGDRHYTSGLACHLPWVFRLFSSAVHQRVPAPVSFVVLENVLDVVEMVACRYLVVQSDDVFRFRGYVLLVPM